jgi:D-methionine transport system ATP-binding protein
MTVEAALTYPLQLQQRSRPEIQAALALWCERLQIPELWRDREAWQLSVGQRQLVAIARALMLKPQVLLLDEPTSALDEGSAQLVFEVLQSCTDLTWLMINHQLDWVRHYCDRVLVLNAGKLTHDQATETFDWLEFSQLLKRDRDTWEEDEL